MFFGFKYLNFGEEDTVHSPIREIALTLDVLQVESMYCIYKRDIQSMLSCKKQMTVAPPTSSGSVTFVDTFLEKHPI